MQTAPAGIAPFYTEGNKEVDVTTQVQLTTADELLHYGGDGYRYELVKGELKKIAAGTRMRSQSAGSGAGNIGGGGAAPTTPVVKGSSWMVQSGTLNGSRRSMPNR